VSDIERFGFAFAPAYRLSASRCPFRSVAGLNAARERHRCRGDRAVRILEDGGARTPGNHRPRPDFATNGDRGVLISFRTPVRGLDPLGVLHHPELTVTVADVDQLAELLRARCEKSGANN
jgi:hypothetical protein